MEWDIRTDNGRAEEGLDWPAIVARAKQKRGEMKLTQRRLAAVSGVSLPTVVQFEAGKDVRISSALAILKVLELVARPVEGVLQIHGTSATGPYRAAFAPYGGSGGAQEPHVLADQKALNVFLDELRVPAEMKRRVLAGLVRDGSADVPSLQLSATDIRRHWPAAFRHS